MSMIRCVHIYDSGFQCEAEALEGTNFCEAHQKVVEFARLQDSTWRKVFLRFVALILLIIFLIPIIFTIRNFYLDLPTEAQEAW